MESPIPGNLPPTTTGPVPARDVPPAPSQIIVMQQGPSGWRRWLSWLGWMGFMLCIPVIIGMMASYHEYFDTSGGIQEKYLALEKLGQDKVAVINLDGVIMDGDGFIKKQIDRVKDDDKVKAIVLRVNSPGGTITGSDYIYHHLKELRAKRQIPLVVSMGGIAASGGYYVSMAVGDQPHPVIFAEPTTTTGSIGVIIPHYDLSGLLERLSVKNDSIASHPRKEMLSMTKAMSPEDRAILEQYVGESFDRFKEIVREGRPKLKEDDSALDKLATGQIFTATQALESGLIDEIGFLEKAVDRAIELAGLDRGQVRVVTYKRPASIMSALGGEEVKSPSTNWQFQAILELSTPRAYYLATTLPVWTRSN